MWPSRTSCSTGIRSTAPRATSSRCPRPPTSAAHSWTREWAQLVLGTQYSPPKTWDNNNTYYWQVRAVDSAGTRRTGQNPARPSSATTRRARRSCAPTAAPRTCPTPYYFDWTSVKHASRYQFQIADNSEHDSGQDLHGRRYELHARSLPVQGHRAESGTQVDLPRELRRVEGPTNYWRVRALDRPFTDPNDPVNVVEGLEWSTGRHVLVQGGRNERSPVSDLQRRPPPDDQLGPGGGRQNYSSTQDRRRTPRRSRPSRPRGRRTARRSVRCRQLPVTMFREDLHRYVSFGVTTNFTVSDTIPTSGAPALTRWASRSRRDGVRRPADEVGALTPAPALLRGHRRRLRRRRADEPDKPVPQACSLPDYDRHLRIAGEGRRLLVAGPRLRGQ